MTSNKKDLYNLVDGWLELESDPGLFTLLLEDMGVVGVQVRESGTMRCGSGMFMPDPGSGSASKNLSIFNSKKRFLSSRKNDVTCSSRIQIHIFPIPDPGVKKAPDPGSGSSTLVGRSPIYDADHSGSIV
jgi:hypothetical protein